MMEKVNIIATISRMEKGLKQGDVARAAGLGESVVSRILNGRQVPTKDQAEKIAKVLDIPTDELFEAIR